MSPTLPLRKTIDIFKDDNNLKYTFKWNEMDMDIEFAKAPSWKPHIKPGKPLLDSDITGLRHYFGLSHNYEPTIKIMEEACYITANQYPYHPIKEQIESVEWDGIERINTWLISAVGAEDNMYNRAVSRKFLVAAVARVYDPGCKFDFMMILEGDQGIGKSTMIEIMAGNWYLDTNFSHASDTNLIEIMRGKWIIEIGELTGFNQKETNWLKQFLSRKVDKVRLPYDRRAVEIARTSVFVGTYNPTGNNMYLSDDTGNRRYWPVVCKGGVDIRWIKDVRDQLWAEAKIYYDKGEALYLDDPNAIRALEEIHQDRTFESPTYKMIEDFVKDRPYVSMVQLIEQALGVTMKGRGYKELAGTQSMVGKVMRKLGWLKGNNDEKHMYFAPHYSLAKYRGERKKGINWEEEKGAFTNAAVGAENTLDG